MLAFFPSPARLYQLATTTEMKTQVPHVISVAALSSDRTWSVLSGALPLVDKVEQDISVAFLAQAIFCSSVTLQLLNLFVAGWLVSRKKNQQRNLFPSKGQILTPPPPSAPLLFPVPVPALSFPSTMTFHLHLRQGRATIAPSVDTCPNTSALRSPTSRRWKRREEGREELENGGVPDSVLPHLPKPSPQLSHAYWSGGRRVEELEVSSGKWWWREGGGREGGCGKVVRWWRKRGMKG